VRLPDPPLLLITDRTQAQRPLADIVRAALAAGCRWVSVREKDLSPADQIILVESLLPLARQFRACLTVHGDPRIAKACDVDGVHLPANGDPHQARALLGPEKLVGLSIHMVGEVRALDPVMVDYAIAGPAYPSASKPGHGPALGTSGLQLMSKAATVPVIAVGGIETATVSEVMRSGAAGVAVMGGIMRARDPQVAITALLRALEQVLAQPRPR